MTETASMAIKKKTVTVSPTVPEPAARSSAGWYKLHNDSGGHVSVYRQEWDKPKELFVLAPGATSSEYEAGHEIYILFCESGEWSPVTWTSSDLSYEITYHVSGYTTSNQVNNVSSFR
ncbi:hypothetical protein ACRS5S_05155 [Nocardia asiatica]|uniref:hypothetical protein n=1 Tax=Nocardia asiatica TaxID=209252 RepID=UPI002453B921|nr:hypothetical protein [Nocardia asiatica]